MNEMNAKKNRGPERHVKIVIFHDFFGSIGGGEKLVLELAKGLGADIITTEVNKKNLDKITTHAVRIINIGNCLQFPILKQIHSSWLFHKADFRDKGYDHYIMSGNWAVFAAKKHKPNLYYIHTPVRMFYDSKDFFYKIAPWYAKWPFLIWVKIHRYYVQKQFKNVDKIVANSRNVQARIKKYHNRNSIVINPPIKRYPFKKFGDFWLSVNRLYPHKRIELQLEVFRRLPKENLIIVGGYMKGDHAKDYVSRILKDIPHNVKILKEVDEKELASLYSECKGFITTAKDEDFGMTVLEANSAGKAVVATNEGGYRETIIDGRNGYLVKPAEKDIISAIVKISKDPSRFKDDCQKQADKYSVEIFIKKIKDILGLQWH